MRLRHNARCSSVLVTDCVPAFTGKCQTTRNPHIYVTFVLFTHYYYFQTFLQNYLLTYLLTYLLMYLHTYIRTYILTYILTYLLT